MALSADLQRQILSAATDPNYMLWNGSPLSEDDTLYQLGLTHRGYRIYDALRKESQVNSCLNVRESKLVKLDRRVIPASSGIDAKGRPIVRPIDKEAAKIVEIALSRFNVDKMLLSLSDAILKGMAAAKIDKWIIDRDGIIRPASVTGVSQDRINFTLPDPRIQSGTTAMYEGWQVRDINISNRIIGDAMPPRRVVVHSRGSKTGNPRGRGVGEAIYWPSTFIRELEKQLLIYGDKFASPTPTVEAEDGVTDNSFNANKAAISSFLEDITQGAWGMLPPGFHAKLLETTRNGGDFYNESIKLYQGMVSKVILGETGTIDQSDGGGSRARDEVAASQLDDIINSDSDLMWADLNDSLIKWISWANIPSANPPTVWGVFGTAVDKKSEAETGKLLFDMGAKPTQTLFDETFGEGWILPSVLQGENSSGEDLQASALNGSQIAGMVDIAEKVRLGTLSPESAKRILMKAYPNNLDAESADLIVGLDAPASQTLPASQAFAAEYGTIIDCVIKCPGLGFDVGVEYVPSQVRFPGRKYSKKLRSAYGHIRGFIGADNEALDCYVSAAMLNAWQNKRSADDFEYDVEPIYQVTQLVASDGSFDEFKFMLGYKTLAEAKSAYLQEMPDQFFGGIRKVSANSLAAYKRPARVPTFALGV